MRFIFSFLAALLCGPALADDLTLLGVGNGRAAVAAGAVLTAPIFIAANSATTGAGYQQVLSAGTLASGGGAATAPAADSPLATSGVLSNFCIASNFTGTSGAYWVYTVTYDDIDTAMTVNTNSITANVPQCDINPAHNVAYAANHKLTIHKTVGAGAPTNDLTVYSFLMTDNAGQFGTLFFGGPNANVTVGTQQYMGAGPLLNATENIVSVVMPTAGHIDNLYGYVSAGTAAQTWALAAQHHTTVSTPCDTNDTAANSLTATSAAGTGVLAVFSDLNAAHGFDVAAGDCVSIGVLASTSVMTATHLFASVRWQPKPLPANNYLYPVFATGTTMPTVTSARFAVPAGVQNLTWNATESQTYNLIPTLGSMTMTIANLVAMQTSGSCPGASCIGTTRSWTLRHGTGAQASINPTCSTTTAMTGCAPGLSSGSSVSPTNFAAQDFIDWQTSNLATATATATHKESFTTNVH